MRSQRFVPKFYALTLQEKGDMYGHLIDLKYSSVQIYLLL